MPEPDRTHNPIPRRGWSAKPDGWRCARCGEPIDKEEADRRIVWTHKARTTSRRDTNR